MKAWIVLPASQNKKENPKLNKGIFTLIFFICKMDLSFPHGPHTFLRTEKGANLKSYLTYCRPLNFLLLWEHLSCHPNFLFSGKVLNSSSGYARGFLLLYSSYFEVNSCRIYMFLSKHLLWALTEQRKCQKRSRNTNVVRYL